MIVFVKQKLILPDLVTTVDSWNLLTSIASSLNPPLLTNGFERTEEGCSDVASLAIYVDGGRHLSVFSPNPKFNQDLNETI